MHAAAMMPTTRPLRHWLRSARDCCGSTRRWSAHSKGRRLCGRPAPTRLAARLEALDDLEDGVGAMELVQERVRAVDLVQEARHAAWVAIEDEWQKKARTNAPGSAWRRMICAAPKALDPEAVKSSGIVKTRRRGRVAAASRPPRQDSRRPRARSGADALLRYVQDVRAGQPGRVSAPSHAGVRTRRRRGRRRRTCSPRRERARASARSQEGERGVDVGPDCAASSLGRRWLAQRPLASSCARRVQLVRAESEELDRRPGAPRRPAGMAADSKL